MLTIFQLRVLLAIPPSTEVKFDRFSDSAGTYITLDSNNPSIYKQLYRAAKAKMKLRLRATIVKTDKNINIMDDQTTKAEADKMKPVAPKQETRQSYLETVLSQPLPTVPSVAPFKAFTESHRPSQPTCAIPGAFHVSDSFADSPSYAATRSPQFSQATLPTFHDFSAGTFSIDCNYCGKSIPNEHYHCSICEKGDFDLCQACVESGIACDGSDHWLIKRSIRNGIVVPSVTETCPPRKVIKQEKMDAPISLSIEDNERTCNSCINREFSPSPSRHSSLKLLELPGSEFVTCNKCPDFDLCLACFENGEHGHHPAHKFEAVDKNLVSTRVKSLCEPGRALIHQATCDGCDKVSCRPMNALTIFNRVQQIVGLRHKCLACPDWDYCSTCKATASETHPGHRFASIYEPLGYVSSRKPQHRGIYCDGPICTVEPHKTYIRGDRYKCAVCHDTDFCAKCEALPTNTHNKTHPLIKIKVPIRHVSVQSIHETEDGQEVGQLGDRPLAKHASTETSRTTSTNAATQVQTVAEVKPAEDISAASTPTVLEADKISSADLQAWYESDSTPDGSSFGPNRLVSQSWTLRNPGPEAWPAGCAVYYIGGDDMRNLDALHPSSVTSMTTANRSNVLDYGLQPGKTAAFTVLLKSPAREGRAISYWRLKTPNGLPFGHKLWVDINVKSTPVELPIRSVPVVSPPAPTVTDEESEKAEDVEKLDVSADSSTMIFPKLEKESPESSSHDIAETPAPVVEPTTKTEEQELLEEVESLELEEESDDDGFLTDEEYDILDASDEDFLLEAQQAITKK